MDTINDFTRAILAIARTKDSKDAIQDIERALAILKKEE